MGAPPNPVDLHERAAQFAKEIYLATGIRITSIEVNWLDLGTVEGPSARPLSTRVTSVKE